MRRHMPLFIDLKSRKVVIFGGGGVAERKARLFSRYAEVVVISKSFTDGILDLVGAGKISLVREELPGRAGEHLFGAFIAVPATDDHRLNGLLEEAAKGAGVLVNRVDGVGDVVVPSIVRREPINIAISTLGVSPALSRYLRTKMEEELDPSYPKMARLLGELRPWLKGEVPDQGERKRMLWKVLLDEEVWSLLGEDPGVAYEKAYMRARKLVTRDERDSLDAGDPQEGEHNRD